MQCINNKHLCSFLLYIAKKTIQQALGYTGPTLIDAPIQHDINVYPMVPPGASNLEMIGGNEDV